MAWIHILAQMRAPRLTEIEQEEEHRLEAMLHWHDPEESENASLPLPRATLIDDNPASG